MQINQNVSNAALTQNQVVQSGPGFRNDMQFRPAPQPSFIAPNPQSSNNPMMEMMMGMMQQMMQVVVTLVSQFSQMLGMNAQAGAASPVLSGGSPKTAQAEQSAGTAAKNDEKKDGGIFGVFKNIYSGIKDLLPSFGDTGIGSVISNIGSKVTGWLGKLF
mgnify:CR=1 FL=1